MRAAQLLHEAERHATDTAGETAKRVNTRSETDAHGQSGESGSTKYHRRPLAEMAVAWPATNHRRKSPLIALDLEPATSRSLSSATHFNGWRSVLRRRRSGRR